MFSFHVLTFGCKVNQYESQAQRERWLAAGGIECDTPEDADLVLLATCAVTAEAVADARQMTRRLARIAPGARLVVTGCAASAAPGDFRLPSLAALVPQTARVRLLKIDPHKLLERAEPLILPEESFVGRREYPPFCIDSFRRARPVLKVQDGCSHCCTYCIVPLTRGPSCSRSPDAVIEEAERLLRAGYREIMISGINLRQYRANGVNFWKLLRQVDSLLAPEWAGRARLRLSSLEPAQLDTEGLETLEACTLLCPHLHLSLQSGSPAVLARMGREHYVPERVEEAIGRVRSFWPDFGLGADILMGFPGESEKEMQETIDMAGSLPFTYAHVFPYSVRPGTRAASLPGQLPRSLRQEHAARVREVIRLKQETFLKRQAGRSVMQIAFDGNGSIHGLNDCYVSCELTINSALPSGHELITARPVGCGKGRIFVELVTE